MYEMLEIFGDIENESKDALCVVCCTKQKDTVILPCRHLCLCSEDANIIRKNSGKCPLCRSDVESYLCMRVESNA